MVDELDQSGQLLNTDRKLAVFRRFLTSLKEDRGWYDYDKQEQVRSNSGGGSRREFVSESTFFRLW